MFHLAVSAKEVIPAEQSGMLFFLENSKKFQEILPIRTSFALVGEQFLLRKFFGIQKFSHFDIFLNFPLHRRSTTESMNK